LSSRTREVSSLNWGVLAVLEWQCEGSSTGWATPLGSGSGLVANDEKGVDVGVGVGVGAGAGVWLGVGVVAREAEAGKESR